MDNVNIGKLGKDEALKLYADGKLSWTALRTHAGFERYGEVLEGLGRLGLSVPILKDEEASEEYRQGIEALRAYIRSQLQEEEGKEA